MTATNGYPLTAHTIAKPVPVFPLVSSTMVCPGRSAPLASASSTMRRAMRSFFDPPGLRYSSLATTRPSRPLVTRESATSGVRPIAANSEAPVPTARAAGGVPIAAEP